MMAQVQISVVLPTYNRATFLPHAIGSVLDQTFADWELIVVDDGSTDETRQVVANYADRRVRYLFQPNQGTAAALNVGLSISRGECVALLGSDDVYLPEYLAAHLACLDKRPEVGLVGSGIEYLDPAGHSLTVAQPWTADPQLDLTTWLRYCPLGAAMLTRRVWCEQVGLFDPSLRVLEDWDFYLRLAYAGCRMEWLEQVLYQATAHPQQKEQDAALLFAQDGAAVLGKFFSQPGLDPALRSLEDPAYGRALLRAARFGYASGQAELARDYLERAIALDPSLMASEGRPLLQSLLAMAASHWVEDPLAYIVAVFANLPPSAEPMRVQYREAIAEAARAAFFCAHRRADWRAVRRTFFRAVAYNPALVSNRGVLSIFVQSLVGRRPMRTMRGFTRGQRTASRAAAHDS